MSAFNKCKDCGSTAPESGWLTKSKSLCVDCGTGRDRLERERLIARRESMTAYLAGTAEERAAMVKRDPLAFVRVASVLAYGLAGLGR